MSSSSSQVDTFWISQKQICYFLFLAKYKVHVKLFQKSSFQRSPLYGLFIAQRIMISALPVDSWLVIDYCSAIITTRKTQPAGPLRVIKPWKRDALWKFIYAYLCYTLLLAIEWHFFTSKFCSCPSRPVCTSHPNFQTFKCRLVVITHLL